MDKWRIFTPVYPPFGGYPPRDKDPSRLLLAIPVMSQSVDDLTADMLRDAATAGQRRSLNLSRERMVA